MGKFHSNTKKTSMLFEKPSNTSVLSVKHVILRPKCFLKNMVIRYFMGGNWYAKTSMLSEKHSNTKTSMLFEEQ